MGKCDSAPPPPFGWVDGLAAVLQFVIDYQLNWELTPLERRRFSVALDTVRRRQDGYDIAFWLHAHEYFQVPYDVQEQDLALIQKTADMLREKHLYLQLVDLFWLCDRVGILHLLDIALPTSIDEHNKK